MHVLRVSPRGLKLDDLAKRAGISPRTVRYYLQRGLLPAPEFRGPDTTYDESHLLRLRAIRRLQDAYWPLPTIASLLESRDLEGIASIVEGDLPPTPRNATAAGAHRPHHASRAASTWERHVLAEGLELWIDEHATAEVRALFESLRARASAGRR
jgi:DNA-binding transcriptional MerR regulator